MHSCSFHCHWLFPIFHHLWFWQWTMSCTIYLYISMSQEWPFSLLEEENHRSLWKRGSPWSSLTSGSSFLLLSFFPPYLNSLLSLFTKDGSIFRNCDASLFHFPLSSDIFIFISLVTSNKRNPWLLLEVTYSERVILLLWNLSLWISYLYIA